MKVEMQKGEKEYLENGIWMKVDCHKADMGKYAKYAAG